MTNTWKRVPIKTVYKGLYDGPHATPKPSNEGPVFLGIKNLSEDGHLVLNAVRHIANEDYPKWIRRVCPRHNDIVFTYEATLNLYAIIPKGLECCLGRRLALIRPDQSKVDPQFLLLYFFSDDWRATIATKKVIGSTVDRIPLLEFPDFPILLPPLPTQRKIAAILSAYDDLIENNTRRIAVLEEMAQAIYREWFVNFRFPGHEKVKMVDSPLGKIPEGWEVGVIKDLVSLLSGFAFKSSTFVEDGEYRLITIKNVHDGVFVHNSESRLRAIPVKMPKHCHLASGDILLSLTGNIGRTCIVYGSGYLLNQRVAKLVPLDPADASFVYAMFRSKDMQVRLINISNGVAQQNLSPVQTAALPHLRPPRFILERYSRIMMPAFWEIVRLNQKNVNLRITRDLLLPRLISGQLNVEDLDIEVGEPLAEAVA